MGTWRQEEDLQARRDARAVERNSHHGPIPEGLAESNPALAKNITPDPTPTLGDIYTVLDELMDRGATLESIQWVVNKLGER